MSAAMAAAEEHPASGPSASSEPEAQPPAKAAPMFRKDQYVKVHWMGQKKLYPGLITDVIETEGVYTYNILYKDGETEEGAEEDCIKLDPSKSNNRFQELEVDQLVGKRRFRNKKKGWSNAKNQYLVKWKGFEKASDDTWEDVENNMDQVQPALERFEATFSPDRGFGLIGKCVLVRYLDGDGVERPFIGTVMEWIKDSHEYKVEWDSTNSCDRQELHPDKMGSGVGAQEEGWELLGELLELHTVVDHVDVSADEERAEAEREIIRAEKEKLEAEEQERNRPRTPSELLERYQAAFDNELALEEPELMWVHGQEFQTLLNEMRASKSEEMEEAIPDKFHPVIAGLIYSVKNQKTVSRVAGALATEIFGAEGGPYQGCISDVVSELATKANYGIKEGLSDDPAHTIWRWELLAATIHNTAIVPTNEIKRELKAVQKDRDTRCEGCTISTES